MITVKEWMIKGWPETSQWASLDKNLNEHWEQTTAAVCEHQTKTSHSVHWKWSNTSGRMDSGLKEDIHIWHQRPSLNRHRGYHLTQDNVKGLCLEKYPVEFLTTTSAVYFPDCGPVLLELCLCTRTHIVWWHYSHLSIAIIRSDQDSVIIHFYQKIQISNKRWEP